MRKAETSLKELTVLLKAMRDEGELEPGQEEPALKAVDKLRHELRVGKRQPIEAAVNELARVFLRDSILRSNK